MKFRALIVAGFVIAGVVGNIAPASADILIGYPPNPFSETEMFIVQQPAPLDVEVLWREQNPGPPNEPTVSGLNPGPPNTW